MKWCLIRGSIAALLVLTASTGVRADLSSVSSYSHSAKAVWDGFPTVTDAGSGSGAPPISDFRLARAGPSISTSTLDISGVQIALDFNGFRAREPNSLASIEGLVEFMVDQASSYELSGAYSLFGGSKIYQQTALYDVTTGTYLFSQEQYSSATPNEVLHLGSNDGEVSNIESGSSLTGTLAVGHVYRFSFLNYVQNVGLPDFGATGDGLAMLDIAPVPAPGAALLCMLGLGLMGQLRKRRAV